MKSAVLHKVSADFDPQRDIPLGPWCFQDAESVYPEWHHLDFINPFSTAGEMEKASLQVAALFDSGMAAAAARFNAVHGTSFSPAFWRHVLLGWMFLIIEVAYVRFRHITLFIERHRHEVLRVKLAPVRIDWRPEDTHEVADLTSRADFDYWLSSMIFRRLAPGYWTLVEDGDFALDAPEKAAPVPEKTGPRSLRHRIRDMVLAYIGRGRAGHIHGAAWKSGLILTLFLSCVKAKPWKASGSEGRWPVRQPLDPAYFTPDFLALIQDLFDATVPVTFQDSALFHRNLGMARERPFKPGKIYITSADLHDDVKKLRTALAAEAGEKVLFTQHGSWYGTVACATMSHMTEYAHYGFLSWGWRDHVFNGNYIPLPAPLLSGGETYTKATDSLIIVDNIANLRSARLSGQPMPAEIVERRFLLRDFIATLRPDIYGETLFRPHIYHSAGIDNAAFLTKVFPDLKVMGTGRLEEELLRSKLYVSNHYGTTLHYAMAKNIPTVCYWKDNPKLTPQAQPYFDLLKDANILFDDAVDAARHINGVWDVLDDWWHSPAVQDARQEWCAQYARASRTWALEWMKRLWAI